MTEEIKISFMEFMHSAQFEEFNSEALPQEHLNKIAKHFSEWDDARISSAIVKTVRELLRRQGQDYDSLFLESTEELLGLMYALSFILQNRTLR